MGVTRHDQQDSTTGGLTSDSVDINSWAVGDTCLVLAIWEHASATISSVTLTGESNLTLIGSPATGNTNTRMQWAVLNNVTASGNKTVTITLSAAPTGLQLSAWRLSGCDTSDAIGANNSATGSGTNTPTLSLTTEAANSAVFAAGSATADDLTSPGSGYTEEPFAGSAFNFEFAEYDLDVGAAGSKTVDCTIAGSSGSWLWAAIEVKAQGVATLTAPVGTALSSLSARVGATTDQNNGVLYVVIATSSTAPTATQIKAGQDHTGSAAVKAGSMMVSAAGALTLDLDGLTPSTGYYAHLVHTTASGDSNIVSSSQFTTPAHGFASGTGPRSVPLAGAGPISAGSDYLYVRSTKPAAGGATTSAAVSGGVGQAAAPVNATHAVAAVSGGVGQAAAPTRNLAGAESAAAGQATSPTQNPVGATSQGAGQASSPTQSPVGAASAGVGQASAPTQSPVGAASDGVGQAAAGALGLVTLTSDAVSQGVGQAATPAQDGGSGVTTSDAISGGVGQASSPTINPVAAASDGVGQAAAQTVSPVEAVSAAVGQASSPTASPAGAVSAGVGQASSPANQIIILSSDAVSGGVGQAAAPGHDAVTIAAQAVSDGVGQAAGGAVDASAPPPPPAPAPAPSGGGQRRLLEQQRRAERERAERIRRQNQDLLTLIAAIVTSETLDE